MLQHGDKTYGPYTMKEDPTAIPKDEELAEQMIGVEICNNDKVLFRGGVLDFGDDYWLYNEDGTLDNFGFTYVTGDGIERDENGNVIDKIEPSASTIYELINDPELTHKGEALAWFGAVFICVLNVLSILFCGRIIQMESIISDSKCRKRRTIRLGNSRKIHRLDSYDYYVIGYFYYRITIIIVFDYTDIQKNTLQGEKNLAGCFLML